MVVERAVLVKEAARAELVLQADIEGDLQFVDRIVAVQPTIDVLTRQLEVVSPERGVGVMWNRWREFLSSGRRSKRCNPLIARN